MVLHAFRREMNLGLEHLLVGQPDDRARAGITRWRNIKKDHAAAGSLVGPSDKQLLGTAGRDWAQSGRWPRLRIQLRAIGSVRVSVSAAPCRAKNHGATSATMTWEQTRSASRRSPRGCRQRRHQLNRSNRERDENPEVRQQCQPDDPHERFIAGAIRSCAAGRPPGTYDGEAAASGACAPS